MIRINGQKDVAVGLIYIGVGSGFFVLAQQYKIGTATNMGPGYFPSLLGILLVLIGAAAIVRGISTTVLDPIPKLSLEPVFLIVASIVSFGLLIERAGLVVATFVCIFLACFRRVLTHPLEVFLTFLALTTFNYIVFIYAFDMGMPMFWWH